MNNTPKTKGMKPLSEKERIISFIYILALFLAIITVCGYFILKNEGTQHIFTNKTIVIKKMERQKEFQSAQSDQMASADSLFSRINNFQPGINASYEENDIKFLINDLAKQWDTNKWDKRNKMFWHLAAIYEMWFADKKELWSKQDNIAKFKKNLEDCELGLQKKEEKLKNRGGK